MTALYSMKRKGGVFIAQIAEHKGGRFLDLRQWVEKDGDLIPTKKGVSLPLGCAGALSEALARAASAEPPAT